MISKQLPQTNPLLTKEQKAALVVIAKLVPVLPDHSLKPNNLEDDGLHFLRRIVKRLNQEFISGG